MSKDAEQSGVVPGLRFPEFREAGAWDAVALRDVAVFASGGTPSKNNLAYWGGDIPWISASSMHELRVSDSDQRVTLKAIGNGTRIAEEGSILILVRGSMLFKRVPICVVTRDVAFNQDVKALRLEKGYDRDFVFHQLISLEGRIAINSTGIGAGKIDTEHLEALKVGRTDPAEQRKIAACLGSLDDWIAAEARALAALRRHKTGLMQQLFPRPGETRPRLRFPEFQNAGEWRVDTLKMRVESMDAGVSVLSGDRPATDGESGVLKTSCVSNGTFRPEENKVISASDQLSRASESVQADTIIMSRMNTVDLVGANAYVERDATTLFLPDRLWALKPKSNANMRYMSYVLGATSGRHLLSSLAKGSSGSMKNITKPDVLALEFAFPEPPEQRRIATCLASLDARLAAHANKLAALRLHKRGLMQQLFPTPP